MYAHLINQTTISTTPPREATIDGAQVVGDLPESYLNSQGWYRLEQTPAPDTQDGYHAEPRYAYDSDETPTRIVQSWEVVQDPPPPPRSLSKVKLMRALKAQKPQELWSAVKAYLQSSDDMWDEWELSTTLDEDHELVKNAVKTLKQNLGMTDEQVEAILAASVAD